MSAALSYYVMRCEHGDELLIADCATYLQAEVRLAAELKRDSAADLSIWASDGTIIALLDPSSGKLRQVRPRAAQQSSSID